MPTIPDPTDFTDLTTVPGVREVTSEDGAVLLDIEQGICFSLNPVGLKIWDLLKQKPSLDQIVDALATEFPIPRDQLRSDASEFIAALRAKNLLRQAGEREPQKSGFVSSFLRRFHFARATRD